MDKKCGVSIQLNAVDQKQRKLPIHKIAWMNLKTILFCEKKRYIEEYILYDSIYMKFKESHNYNAKK